MWQERRQVNHKLSDCFICPNCDAEVPMKALSCPECGSDEQTGWSDDTMYDGMDLPAFETYEKAPAVSFFRNKYFLYIVAIITILAFLWLYVL